MARNSHHTTEGLTEDIGYKAARTGALVLGKTTAPLIGGLLEPSLAFLTSALPVGIVTGVLGASGVTVALVAVFTAISAAISQSDHLHRRKLLLNEYREEIGSVVGKNPQLVTEQDMDRVAAGDKAAGITSNPALKESLQHSKMQRNLGIVISSLASIGAFVIGQKVFGGDSAAHGQAQAAHDVLHVIMDSTISISEKITTTLSHVGVSLASYFAIQTPLHAVGDKLFGLDKNLVQNHVDDIRRTHEQGQLVSQEKILEAHLSANPALAEQIVQSHGKEFSELDNNTKLNLIRSLNAELQLEKSAEAINLDHMKPQEIAFKVHNQSSGVEKELPKAEAPKQNMFGQWVQKLFSPSANPNVAEPQVKEVILPENTIPGTTKVQFAQAGDDNSALRIDNQFEAPGMKQSFVAMVGKSATSNSTYVEQVMQSRLASHDIVITP